MSHFTRGMYHHPMEGTFFGVHQHQPSFPCVKVERPQQLPRDFNQKDLIFDVDDSAFEDRRPVYNYIGPGQREFKLFDDYKKSGADQIKNVYNVNTMDYCNAREICGKRLYQQSIERWPVDAIAGDLGELRKQALTIPGRLAQSTFMNILDLGLEFDNTCFKNNSSSFGPAGPFGLMSLARCLNGEGGEKNKMGYVTFVGMNLHKLFKDIDRSEPVCPTFAGPLADRNYQLEHGEVGVYRGFPEYELMDWGKADWRHNFQRKTQFRFKRRIMEHFSFDTLVFMFYTFHGDALQLLAAQHLYKRGWRFHKLFQVWMCPEQQQHPGQTKGGRTSLKSSGWVPGVYRYFDYHKWDFFKVELKHVNDSVLEGRPMEFFEALWE